LETAVDDAMINAAKARGVSIAGASGDVSNWFNSKKASVFGRFTECIYQYADAGIPLPTYAAFMRRLVELMKREWGEDHYNDTPELHPVLMGAPDIEVETLHLLQSVP
jgi:hypothetical protein